MHRRSLLNSAGLGIGSIAAATLLGRDLPSAIGQENTASDSCPSGLAGAAVGVPHFPATAKRVIFLYMAGGPSHLETFDYKPKLDELDGQAMPTSFTAGQPIAQLQGKELKVQGHLTKFAQHGNAGTWVSSFLPHQAKIVDDIAVIKSVVAEQINHDPAHTFMNTGTAISGRPSMGSWINYGLGSEANDLPGFVVMTSVGGRNPQPIATRQWSAGFLPSRYQGVPFNSGPTPVHYLDSPPGVSDRLQSAVVRSIGKLDSVYQDATGNRELETRIRAYELAARMQSSVPGLVDLADESQSVLDEYGVDNGKPSFAANCLIARRLAQRGVRFIQLYHRGWDHHGDLVKHMNTCCKLTDQPTAALVKDLKRLGMLDDTLVIWGGEFGRTPMFQGKGGPGRDHHIKGFSMWMAGAGIRGGTSHGATDELGYNAVESPVQVRDLHATILHCLGIDHQKFSVPYQGLDSKLTGVEPARVVRDILS